MAPNLEFLKRWRRDAAGPRTASKAGRPLEEWTKRELYDRARELGVENRSRMNKAELMAALQRRHGRTS